ncbi:MAG: serpin family protein [Clostridiales bacterium]|nr:serpin family protein [Clostridiales bacterium]
MYLSLDKAAELMGFSVNSSDDEETVYIEDGSAYEEYEDGEADVTEKTGASGFASQLDSLMDRNENYVLSPLSIKYALAMAAGGADFETKEEILKALNVTDFESFNAEAEAYMDSFESVEKEDEESGFGLFEEVPGTSLSIANSVWLNEDYIEGGDFSEEYKGFVKGSYNAETGTVTNEDAVEKINRWCSEKTNGKINGIISSPDFMAGLVNAVYFNGKWTSEFNEGDTEKDIFTNSDGTEAETDFMSQTGRFKYYADDDVKIVSLPYLNSSISMYLALTEDSGTDVLKYADKTEYKKVKIKMPKFKTETSVDAVGFLEKMGIEKAFDSSEGAYHFKYMFNDTVNNTASIYISKVLHKTYISVDEEGTEAAAVTSMIMMATASLEKPEEIYEFNADRPFTYFIRDNSNGEILFMGRYARAE